MGSHTSVKKIVKKIINSAAKNTAREITRGAQAGAALAHATSVSIQNITKAGSHPVEEALVTIRKIVGPTISEKTFKVIDGKELKSIKGLIDYLEHMADNTFSHHVTDVRNDFSNWMRDVFDEHALANHVEHAAHRLDMQRQMMHHLLSRMEHSLDRKK